MRHTFEPTRFHLTFGSHDPVLQIGDGDTVATWCVDAGGYDRDGKQITDGGNPQTGPFSVQGADPGDTLAVRFDRLWPNRPGGFTAPLVAPNVVDPRFLRELPVPERNGDDWSLDLERGTASLESPPAGLERLELPSSPSSAASASLPDEARRSPRPPRARTAGTWITAGSEKA